MVYSSLTQNKKIMFSPFHAIMIGILLILGPASIIKTSEGDDGLVKNQSKSSKLKFDLNNY